MYNFFDQVDSFGTQAVLAMCTTEGYTLGNPLDDSPVNLRNCKTATMLYCNCFLAIGKSALCILATVLISAIILFFVKN